VRHHARVPGAAASLGKVDILVITDDHTIAVEYDGAFWHASREDADRRKHRAVRAAGHYLVRVREAPLAPLHADDVVISRNAGPHQAASATLARLSERGWLSGLASAAANGYIADGVAIGAKLAGQALADIAHRDLGNEALAVTHPELAAQWDTDSNGDLTAQHVRADWSRPVWWLCLHGDRYKATPGDRSRRGRGCPFCSGKQVNARTCLATMRPDLVAEFADSNGNSPFQVGARSHKPVDWCCSRCGHRWTTPIRQRADPRVNSGCPACAGKIATPTRNLLVERPDVAALWHPSANRPLTPDQVLPRSGRAVAWLCPKCGDTFHAKPADRVEAAHQCCRNCAKGRRP
jgi:hypothetical protein